jgi:hypothetical protein
MMLVFGQIEPIGMGNLMPLPKKTAKGLEGAVYNQFAERMYRLLPHRSMPTPTPLVNFEVPIRFISPYIDPADDELRFTAITENGRFLSYNKQPQYVRYFNPARNIVENREGFEQGYIVDHTVLSEFVVNNPATEPTVIATFTLPAGSGTKKVVGAGTLGDGNTATIFPLLQHKPFVRATGDNNLSAGEVVLIEDHTTSVVFDPPYRIIVCYYVETPKERILLPATLSNARFTRTRFFVNLYPTNMPAEVRNNIAGAVVIVLWADQARIVEYVPITFGGSWIVNLTPQTLTNEPPFNFHTANLPYNPRAIKTVGNRTFYLYPNEVRISAVGRMWDIPDDLAPIGTAGGGAIVDVPNILDVIPFGSQFLLLTKQGIYRLFEPIEGEWTAVLLPYPPPRLVGSSVLFPVPVQTTPQGVSYYGGMWFEIAGANETINITRLPFTLLPLLKIDGSEPSIAVDTNGKVYLILDEAFYEVETAGGKDVVAFNGRYFFAKDTSLYEIDPFASV